MKFFKFALIIFMAFTFLAYPCETFSAGDTGKVSMDFKDAELKDVLRILSQQAGKNFVAAEGIENKKITVYFDNIEAAQAIAAIMDANNLLYEEADGGVYIVRESGKPKISTITKIFSLKFARVVPTVGDLIGLFGVPGGVSPSAKSTTSVSSGSSSGGSSSGSSGSNYTQNLSNIDTKNPGEWKRGIVGILRNLLSKSGSIMIDERTNSLIITDVPSRFKTIEETIALLDVQVPQVLIEIKILEVNSGILKRIGVEWGGTDGEVFVYQSPMQPVFFPFSKFAGLRGTDAALNPQTIAQRAFTMGRFFFAPAATNLTEATVKLLAQDSDTKFLATPKLLTLNNEIAEMKIVTDTAIGLTSTNIAQSGSVINTAERAEIGTILRITPQVNANGYITMVVEPEVSSAAASQFITGFVDPSIRAVRTTLMLKDGDTVMIGGLIKQNDNIANRKVPLLGDIPILGIPFRRLASSKTDTEIIVFITPRILQGRTGYDFMQSTGGMSIEDVASLPREQEEPMQSRQGALDVMVSGMTKK